MTAPDDPAPITAMSNTEGDGSLRRVPPDVASREATIIDGTGAPRFVGDVEIDGGVISCVGSAAAGSQEIDGRGLVLAPGFVDTHTHDDGALLAYPGMTFKLAQGCTSLVIGNCGFSAVPNDGKGQGSAGGLLGRWKDSFVDLDGFGAAVMRNGVATNFVSLIGHNTMR